MYLNPIVYWVLIIASLIYAAHVFSVFNKVSTFWKQLKDNFNNPKPKAIYLDLTSTNVGSKKESYPPSNITLSLLGDYPTIYIRSVDDKLNLSSKTLSFEKWLDFMIGYTTTRSIELYDADLSGLFSYKDFNLEESIKESQKCWREVGIRPLLSDILTANVMSTKISHRSSHTNIILDPYYRLVSNNVFESNTILNSYLSKFLSKLGHESSSVFTYTKGEEYKYSYMLDQLLNIQKTVWEHHTSKQLYRILGFLLDTNNVICVVYKNTGNHALYHRPAKEWLRSMNPHSLYHS